jgi:hypothetical protein
MPSGNNLWLWWGVLPLIATGYAVIRTAIDYRYDKNHRDEEE